MFGIPLNSPVRETQAIIIRVRLSDLLVSFCKAASGPGPSADWPSLIGTTAPEGHSKRSDRGAAVSDVELDEFALSSGIPCRSSSAEKVEKFSQTRPPI